MKICGSFFLWLPLFLEEEIRDISWSVFSLLLCRLPFPCTWAESGLSLEHQLLLDLKRCSVLRHVDSFLSPRDDRNAVLGNKRFTFVEMSW